MNIFYGSLLLLISGGSVLAQHTNSACGCTLDALAQTLAHAGVPTKQYLSGGMAVLMMGVGSEITEIFLDQDKNYKLCTMTDHDMLYYFNQDGICLAYGEPIEDQRTYRVDPRIPSSVIAEWRSLGIQVVVVYPSLDQPRLGERR